MSVHYFEYMACPVRNLSVPSQREKIKENKDKIKLNKQLPWLVGNVVEVRSLLSLVVVASNVF